MSDRLIGFASVDPHQSSAAEQLNHAVDDLGLRGMKLDPAMQEFYADDKLAYPLYERAQKLGIPILFHAGLSWAPGSRLKYGHPLRFEDVAADFPKLRGHLIDQVCAATGGPCTYKGGDMKSVHKGQRIDEASWTALVEDLVAALDHFKVPAQEKGELLGALGGMHNDIVEVAP